MTEVTQKQATNIKDIKEVTPLYDHGLPFSSWTVPTLDSLKKRIKLKKASCIAIDGPMGEGKTTLATHIADYFQAEPIDLKKAIGMGGTQFREKFLEGKKELKAIIYDEAGDFSKRGALTKFNREMSSFFETYRGFGIMVIVVLPNFNVLDKMLFDNQVVRVLFHCHDRTDKQGNYAVYDYESMMYLRHYMTKEVVTPKAYKMVTPNSRGHFLDLSPSRSKTLDKLSTEAKLKKQEDSLANMQDLLTIAEVSRKIGFSPSWVRSAMASLNIKPVKKRGHTKYYDKNIGDVLLDYKLNMKDKRKKENMK